MSLLVCVYLSTWGLHVTITHDALDFTVQGSHRHQTWAPTPALAPQDIRNGGPLVVAIAPPLASDILWPSLDTCSNLFT